MGAKTLNPADGAPGTLAAGELVWAKPKGRRTRWWPARLLAARPAAAARATGVAYFGDPGAPPGPAAQVRRFADPDADGLASGSIARAFLSAVAEAHASAVAALRASLTCGCVPPPPAPEAGVGAVVVGVSNLSPAEFLAALRDAALPGSPVGLVGRARLKSWVRAFGEGWGPGGAGHYPRCSLAELVDKIDLDIPASDDKEDDEWLADAEDVHPASERPQETPAPQKKRRAASRMDKLDAGEDEDRNDNATRTGTSRKRERKRSKYLSPPYTNLGVFIKLPRKAADSPKALTAESDSEVLPGSIDVEEVLSLVLCLVKDVSHGSHFPKAAEAFLRSFRSTKFKCQTEVSEGHESPAAHAVGKDVDIAAGVVSDSQTFLEQSKCAAKRSKKNDDDERAGTSIKRQKREKYFPAATVYCDVTITPAIPIKSVQMEATGSEAKVCTDESVQNVISNLAVANVSREAAEPANVCIDVPVQSVAADDVFVQNVGADVPVENFGADVQVENVGADVPVENVGADYLPLPESVQSFGPDVRVQSVCADGVPVQNVGGDVCVSSEPSTSTVDRNIAQAVHENAERSSVQINTVQQSYASLQAMVPEVLEKVTNINGTDIIPVNHALKDERQKDEQPNQKVKITVGSMANHVSDQAANGVGPDATNSTPKKKKKKTTQLFVDPAEIIVEFTPGVIMPSREELLSAFCKFGFIIESWTNVTKVTRSARVVFGKKAEAENAYRRAEFLGEFGPPFATLKLADLPPIELSAPSPPHSLISSSRPPLTDIRKNLERMILARHSSLKNATSADGLKPVSDKLLADMQGLLAQVDKMLSGPSTSTPP